MAAKIRKGDLVEVVRGRTSDEKKLKERNARREAEGLEPLAPGDKGKQGRVIKVFPAEQKVLVEGVNLKTRHVKQGARQQAGGISTVEAPISVAKVALVDPDTKKPVRVGFKEEQVERNGRSKTIRTRVIRSGENAGKEV
ncbi:50S ribosomal protein L24 [Actinomycetaceae bacterium WB03_NA08]|uniref:Large ribosomal subunit protein uL24 n=1 Tax=Scrofimicrobium canadense TaxID=2652290 RepID=A0A6N7W5M3_9ACTO|nr:50S ribosomal protein L24 [Scrofimicrobium canadense]MSS83803.1 50S ribosomal protein L24 [Scrofimicrobium canadense]